MVVTEIILLLLSDPYSTTMKLRNRHCMIQRCMEKQLLILETIFPKNKKCGEEDSGR